MVTIKVQFLLMAFLLFLNSVNTAMATEDAGIKATQIFAIAGQVSWPTSDETVTFCVIGAPDVAEILRNKIKGRKFKGRELQVGTSGCNVIFGSTNTSSGVLTISDGRGCSAGAIFDFYKEDGRVEFSYSAAAGKRFGLDIGARALGLAKKRC